MTVLDIREKQDEYTTIKFSDIGEVTNIEGGDSVRIFATSLRSSLDDDSIIIKGEEEANNLIKALETAIDMGWLEDDS